MRGALSLARRGLGNVAPNPAVGCLIVKDGVIWGRGWTQPGGRPHAETVALNQAGSSARGATVYVSLEPCAHHGVTPPCAEALIEAGVARVVIAVGDSDSRVSGRGVQLLIDAGIEVRDGICSGEASYLNLGFFLSVTTGRPLYSLKVASTIDGKIATKEGESKWITGPVSRRFGHMLRAQHDAILVGVNTILEDDPDLRCRIDGLEMVSPIRVILDSKLQTDVQARVFEKIKQAPVWVVASENMRETTRAKVLAAAGAKLFFVNDLYNQTSLDQLFVTNGVTRVLVEGGAKVHASFIKENRCDVLYHFVAGKLIGNEGVSGIGNIGLAQLGDAPHLNLISHQRIGEDLLATYRNAE